MFDSATVCRDRRSRGAENRMEKNSDFDIKYWILLPIEWHEHRIGPVDELVLFLSRRWPERWWIEFINS